MEETLEEFVVLFDVHGQNMFLPLRFTANRQRCMVMTTRAQHVRKWCKEFEKGQTIMMITAPDGTKIKDGCESSMGGETDFVKPTSHNLRVMIPQQWRTENGSS